jgi:hypothetical protein
VKLAEWIREKRDPPFASIEQWLRDQMGHVGLEEEAVYAIELRPDHDPKGYAVRILVAAEQALADFTWERPDEVERRHLTATFYPWSEVAGLRLLARTELDPGTLMHEAPRFGMRLDEPRLELPESEVDPAVLAFWKACLRHVETGSK